MFRIGFWHPQSTKAVLKTILPRVQPQMNYVTVIIPAQVLIPMND